MFTLILKPVIWAHNFLYRLIGVLSIKENDGIHPKHKILKYEQFFIKNISSGDNVLDIGCGNGFLASAVSRKAKKVFGIDISEKNIALAKKRFQEENVEYIVGDATTHEFKENFDAIILSNVLEHIENRTDFLKDIKRLAPRILIRVPLLSRDWLAVYKKEKGFEYRLDNTHFTEYTEESFQKEMSDADLKIENTEIKFGELYAVATKIQN